MIPAARPFAHSFATQSVSRRDTGENCVTGCDTREFVAIIFQDQFGDFKIGLGGFQPEVCVLAVALRGSNLRCQSSYPCLGNTYGKGEEPSSSYSRTPSVAMFW